MDVELGVRAGMGLAAGATSAAGRGPARWTMPVPRFGIVVWKHQDGSQGDCYAIVTRVNPSMIDVMLFPNAYSQPVARYGVKHVQDPSLRAMKQPNVGGVWDFCPGELEFNDLFERLRRIVEQQSRALRELGIEGPAEPDEGAA